MNIRPARPDEYDDIARIWMESWVSTGLAEASNFLLANLRARVARVRDDTVLGHATQDAVTERRRVGSELPVRPDVRREHRQVAEC